MKRHVYSLLLACCVASTMIGCSTTPRNSRAWDYKIIYGPVRSAVTPPGTLGEQLDRAAADGWEVVSSGNDSSHGPFIVLRRAKE